MARENTLEAFALALEFGATGLESDVWLTADGVAVLDHDGYADDAERVPIASVVVAELPAHIPRLSELYDLSGARDVDVSLDVKDPSAVEAVVADARTARAADRLWLCHHRWRLLSTWRTTAPEVRLVDSTYVGFMAGGPSVRLGRLRDAGVDAVNLHHSEWTDDLRGLVAAHGLAALSWDAQDGAALARAVALGVDGVFSDHVDLMVAAVRG